MLHALGATIPSHDWYQSSTELPLGEDQGLLRIASSRLQRALGDAGITCRSLSCEVIDADAFNDQVDQIGNKASINFAAVLRLVDELRVEYVQEDLHIVIDRQGGRTTYRQDLQQAWPDDTLKVLDEQPSLCRYQLHPKDGPCCTITFAQGGETRHLPIALASMTAKYCRELLMLRLNRWFMDAQPDLEPTAGYVQDARRYLEEIQPVIESRSIERTKLVRVC